ncbi:MAG: hypothetical protein KA479_04405 [Saprospiraceae bacterium]|nr:hypothetical protein [Saprospiraceae bacterium]
MMKSLLQMTGLAAMALLLSNCASLSGFQDGRTVGKDKADLSVSLNLSQSPDFNDWEDQDDSLETDIPNLFFPSIEVGGRYGVAENFDINMKLNTNLNISVGAKFQLLGGQESMTALAVGAEVGTFGLVSGLWNVQIPVYFSLHPSERFSWYLSPRYIYQFTSYAGADNGLNYIGGNTGILFGRRHKFGLDVGYYNVGNSDLDGGIGLLQIGVGGRFSLNRD